MPDVFISFSSQDGQVAEAAKHYLESERVRCWKAPESISPGQLWEEAIVSAIGQSRVMLLIWSTHSQASKQVGRELSLAANADKVIIPFRLEQIEPTGSFAYYLTNTHWLDAVSPDLEASLERLTRKIIRILHAVPVTADPAQHPSGSPDSPSKQCTEKVQINGTHQNEKTDAEGCTNIILPDDAKASGERDHTSLPNDYVVAEEEASGTSSRRAKAGAEDAEEMLEKVLHHASDLFNYFPNRKVPHEMDYIKDPALAILKIATLNAVACADLQSRQLLGICSVLEGKLGTAKAILAFTSKVLFWIESDSCLEYPFGFARRLEVCTSELGATLNINTSMHFINTYAMGCEPTAVECLGNYLCGLSLAESVRNAIKAGEIQTAIELLDSNCWELFCGESGEATCVGDLIVVLLEMSSEQPKAARERLQKCSLEMCSDEGSAIWMRDICAALRELLT